jgi:hypothetical protein
VYKKKGFLTPILGTSEGEAVAVSMTAPIAFMPTAISLPERSQIDI